MYDTTRLDPIIIGTIGRYRTRGNITRERNGRVIGRAHATPFEAPVTNGEMRNDGTAEERRRRRNGRLMGRKICITHV